MRHESPKIEMRIVNVRFPRFIIVDWRRYSPYWHYFDALIGETWTRSRLPRT